MVQRVFQCYNLNRANVSEDATQPAIHAVRLEPADTSGRSAFVQTHGRHCIVRESRQIRSLYDDDDDDSRGENRYTRAKILWIRTNLQRRRTTTTLSARATTYRTGQRLRRKLGSRGKDCLWLVSSVVGGRCVAPENGRTVNAVRG